MKKYLIIGGAAVVILAGIANLRQCVGPPETAPKAKTGVHYNAARPISAATTVTPATAGTAQTPARAAPEQAPPEGIKRGYIEQRVLAQDQYTQWVTLTHATLSVPSLDVTVAPPPEGSDGKRRTEFRGWIHTDVPTNTVTVHIAGYDSTVTTQLGGWTSDRLSHSNAWTADPTSGRYVVSLAVGWHRFSVIVIRKRGYANGDAHVRVQLGSSTTDPVVPVPYAVPDNDQPEPAGPASVVPTPAATSPTPTSSDPASGQGGRYAS